MEKIKFNDNLDMIWFHDEVYETVDCIDFNDFLDMVHEDFDVTHEEEIELEKAFNSCHKNIVRVDSDKGIVFLHGDHYSTCDYDTFEKFFQMIHKEYDTSYYVEIELKKTYELCKNNC